jgi:hypothetical protein
MTFLSLAPTTSASYPTSPAIKSPTQTTPEQGPTTEVMKTLEIEEISLNTRRSSSSDSGRGFLKLGPVHFGEGDGKGDWSEHVVA